MWGTSGYLGLWWPQESHSRCCSLAWHSRSHLVSLVGSLCGCRAASKVSSRSPLLVLLVHLGIEDNEERQVNRGKLAQLVRRGMSVRRVRQVRRANLVRKVKLDRPAQWEQLVQQDPRDLLEQRVQLEQLVHKDRQVRRAQPAYRV